jgi:hypothetical protein
LKKITRFHLASHLKKISEREVYCIRPNKKAKNIAKRETPKECALRANKARLEQHLEGQVKGHLVRK